MLFCLTSKKVKNFRYFFRSHLFKNPVLIKKGEIVFNFSEFDTILVTKRCNHSLILVYLGNKKTVICPLLLLESEIGKFIYK